MWQEPREQPRKADGFRGEICPDDLIARGRGIALVEDEVDDMQHPVQPFRQFVPFGDLVGNFRRPDLVLRTNDALRHSRGGDEKRVGDLLGRKPAYFSKSHRHLRVSWYGWMAAREDQAEHVVFDQFHVADLRFVERPIEAVLDVLHRHIKS